MNTQEAFDAMWQHAKTMPMIARNLYGKCSYRTETGNKCLIGCLIPDRIYNHTWDTESMSVVALLRRPEIQEILGNVDPKFLSVAQGIHDSTHSVDWRERLLVRLRYLAMEYKLEVPNEDAD